MNYFRMVLMIIFGLLFLIGIAMFALQSTDGSQAELPPVTVWGTFPRTIVDAALQEASLRNNGYRSISYIQLDPQQYRKEYTDALASGAGPDLVILTDQDVVSESSKMFAVGPENMTQLQFSNLYVEAASVFSTSQGIIGFPLLVDPVVLYWNRDLLAKHGFTLPPRTWEDVTEMASVIAEKDDSGSLELGGVALGDYRNIRNAKQIYATLLMQVGNPIVQRGSDGKLVAVLSPESDQQRATKAANALKLYTSFSDPGNQAYSWSTVFPEAQVAFAQERVAMYIGYASEREDIRSLNPNLSFSVSAMPQFSGTLKPVTSARVYALAIPRGGQKPSAAFSAMYLLSDTAFVQYLSNGLGMATAFREALAIPEDSAGATDLASRIRSQASSFRDLVFIEAARAKTWFDPNPTATAYMIYEMIDSVITGQASAEEAGNRANEELTSLLQ